MCRFPRSMSQSTTSHQAPRCGIHFFSPLTSISADSPNYKKYRFLFWPGTLFVPGLVIWWGKVIASHKEFAKRLDTMETRLVGHDENFRIVFQAPKQMVQEEEKPKRKIGF